MRALAQLFLRPFVRDQRLALGAGLVLAGLLAWACGFADGYTQQVAMKAGIAVVLAASLNLVNGYTGQFSLGHAGFMAIGAYTAAALTTRLPYQDNPWAAAPVFALALLAGGAVAALFGLAVGIPSLRVRGDYLALVTLGFGEMVGILVRAVPGLGGAAGIPGIPDYTTPLWVAGAAALTLYVVGALVHSTWGRGFLAVADDEIASASLGLRVTRYKVFAFAVGAFFAGLAGALSVHLSSFLDPRTFGFTVSIEAVVMVILGGAGNLLGVSLAAVFLTVVPELLRDVPAVGQYRLVFFALLLVVVMLARPQGLLDFHLPKVRRRAAGEPGEGPP